MKLIKKISKILKILLRKMPADPRAEKLLKLKSNKHLINTSANEKFNLAGRILAIQGVEDPLFQGLFLMLALDLRAKVGVEPWMLQIRSINGAVGTGVLATIKRSWLVNSLINAQWRQSSVNAINGVAYQSGGWESPLTYWRRRRVARDIRQQILRNGDLANLKIEGILVGDLVIDTYLRYRPAGTVDIKDKFIERLLAQALREVSLAKAWFEKAKPLLYLSSYSTYLEHGIAVRVALESGTPVRVFGNPLKFGKRVSKDYPFHSTNGKDYLEINDASPIGVAELIRAKTMLEERMNGKIDAATSYMRESAYKLSLEPVPNINGAVVLFLHDFFDSPHIYPDMIFDDFWEWACFTIKTLHEAGIKFYVKPHPNQIQESTKILEKLRIAFPETQIISTRVNNRQLVDAGMGAGVTVYGTVAHELAYLGVPVICCARHPHIAFDFCRTAKNIEEYQSMLRKPFELPVKKEIMRDQALLFYYVHNLNYSEKELDLRNNFAQLIKIRNDNKADSSKLTEFILNFSNEKSWSMFLEDLINDMKSIS